MLTGNADAYLGYEEVQGSVGHLYKYVTELNSNYNQAKNTQCHRSLASSQAVQQVYPSLEATVLGRILPVMLRRVPDSWGMAALSSSNPPSYSFL